MSCMNYRTVLCGPQRIFLQAPGVTQLEIFEDVPPVTVETFYRRSLPICMPEARTSVLLACQQTPGGARWRCSCPLAVQLLLDTEADRLDTGAGLILYRVSVASTIRTRCHRLQQSYCKNPETGPVLVPWDRAL